MAHNGCVVLMDKKPSPNWVVIDATGQSKEKYLNKSEVMDLVQINARDLRLLDLNLSYPSTILGREKAIVLNLEHIKAIITSKEVLLRLRDPSDEIIIPVVKEFQRRLPNEGEEDDFPFEFRALEVALEAICSFLAARTTDLETDAYPVLEELTSKISSRNLDRLRKVKGSMSRLIARVQKVRDEFEKLLDDDDDMAHLYLSRATLSPYRGDENVVEEIESLLEAYFMQIDSTLNKLTTLCEYIDDTEDYINIQLDNHRNQLIQLELVLSSLTVCSSLYSLVAGIFGMNIKYTWNNDHGYMFKHVVIVTGTMCVVLFIIIMSYARYKGLDR